MAQYETDLVVFAAGASGLAASVAAAQLGLESHHLEKGSTTGAPPTWAWATVSKAA